MTSSRAILAAAAGVVLLASCSSASREGDAELDRFLCTRDDLAWQFQEQVSGSFSANDLGSLGDGSDERKAAYREAGLQRGRFVFWKESLPRPPFEPPVNVVCQVLVFREASEAQAWVDNLEADAAEIGATGIVWLPGDERTVTELDAPSGERAFQVAAEEGDARVVLFALYSTRDNLVLSVFAGDTEGRLDLADVRQIQAERDARADAVD